MVLNHLLKTLNRILILLFLTLPFTIANAQPEDEEEEPIQTRPNPMDSRSNMKGMNQRSYDGFDGESKTQSTKMHSGMQHKMKDAGKQQLNLEQQRNMMK